MTRKPRSCETVPGHPRTQLFCESTSLAGADDVVFGTWGRTALRVRLERFDEHRPLHMCREHKLESLSMAFEKPGGI